MPKIGQMIESKYLKKEDVEDGQMLVTITKIGQANIAMEDQPADMKWMIRFTEFKKPMVLNSTNIQLLAKACGSDDTDDWIGKEVVLYVDDSVQFAGKLVGGLRIRSAKPAQPKRPAGAKSFEDMTDDVPF